MQLYSIIMDKTAVLDPGLLFKLAFMTSLWPKLKPRLKAERLEIHGQMLSKVPRYFDITLVVEFRLNNLKVTVWMEQIPSFRTI